MVDLTRLCIVYHEEPVVEDSMLGVQQLHFNARLHPANADLVPPCVQLLQLSLLKLAQKLHYFAHCPVRLDQPLLIEGLLHSCLGAKMETKGCLAAELFRLQEKVLW